MTMTRPTSEQITFTGAGVGAQQRLLVDKVRETVSVKDFGAVGDGVTDDTAAVQAAIAHAATYGGTVVFPPAQTYLANITITTPNPTSGVTLMFLTGQYLNKTYPALLPFDPALPVITLGTSTATAQHVHIIGLTTWGRSGDQRFMLVNSASYCTFERLTLGNFQDYLIRITSRAGEGTYFLNFSNCSLLSGGNSTCRILELDYGLSYNNACSFSQCNFGLRSFCETGILCTSTSAQMVHWFTNVWIEGGPNNTLTRGAHVKCTGNVQLLWNNVNIDSTSNTLALDYDEDNYPTGVIRGVYGINGRIKSAGTLAAAELPFTPLAENALCNSMRVKSVVFSDISITPQISQIDVASERVIEGFQNNLVVRNRAANGTVVLSPGVGGVVRVTEATGGTSGTFQVGTATVRNGTGSPEGAVTAPVGSLFLRSDGGAGSTLYVKESGAGNTGWAAK